MPSGPMAWRSMRLRLLLLAAGAAACTVVNDSYEPRRIEALRSDAGSPGPLPDAGLEPTPEPLPTPPELTLPELPVQPDAGNSCIGSAEPASCDLPQVAPPSCSDGEQNQGEGAADCGGPCPTPCADGQSCTRPEDCTSAFCNAAGRCALASCADGELNGGELDADCGGSCPTCPAGTACTLSAACATGVCLNGACAAATCDDQVLNQDEAAIDCGGSCPPCLPGARCNQPSDCSQGVCQAQGCAVGVALCCQPARCNDDVRNGNEPVTDCGAAPCPLCPIGNDCTANAQCTTNRCLAGTCAPPPCFDDVQNGTESDEDCGGTDPTCIRCAVGQDCNVPADCASGSCLDGECADCDNNQQDGNETDEDCGGSCGPCATGEECEADADCTSGQCVEDRCCGGNQGDCTRCARELVSNITCANNGAAAEESCDDFLECLQDNPGACINRTDATCTAAGAVCDPSLFGGNGSPGIVLADSILGTAQCQF